MVLGTWRRNALLTVLVMAMTPFVVSEPEKKPNAGDVVLAWSFGEPVPADRVVVGTYLLPSDGCYEQQRKLIGSKAKYFQTASDAEGAGYMRQRLGLKELRKYCDVCSPLYHYCSQAKCERILLNTRSDLEVSSYVPIESFGTQLYQGKVAAVEGTGIYRTPCDPDYRCLVKLSLNSASPECRGTVRPGKAAIVFETEQDARKAGYISVYEWLYDEREE